MSDPQRPTENEAIVGMQCDACFVSIENGAVTYHPINPKPLTLKMPAIANGCMTTPLWFDPDEDVEIEAPEDEAPETGE